MQRNLGRLRSRWIWVAAAVAAGLLSAAEPAWKTKPVPAWTEEEARQVLDDSPWAKTVNAGVMRPESEDERREGGKMGQEHGVGYDGVDPQRTGPRLPSNIFRGTPSSAAMHPGSVILKLRWESALPVRVAEVKARETEPPTLPGEGYSLAVYGIPLANVKSDPAALGEPLRKLAVLKREGKKDVRPIRVEVFQREDGFVAVYLFPLSAEISEKDGRIEFDAQIGRIGVTQTFDLGEMRFQGKLEL